MAFDPTDYNWQETFAVSRRDGTHLVAGAECSDVGFDLGDVACTLSSAEGENDGEDWLWAGQLKDGRWAFVRAGCDYTGWG